MNGFQYLDIFATKGVEYIVVILFFVALVPFWLYLMKPAQAAVAATPELVAAVESWFRLKAGAFFHPGHTWAMPVGNDVVRIGVDDFAQKLVGTPDALELPAVGGQVRQGQPCIGLSADAKALSMLAPVSGEVVSVNQRALEDPELINRSPYDEGWLLQVRSPGLTAELRNLLSGTQAAAWIEQAVASVRLQMGAGAAHAIQDGGAPVPGFARHISPERWDAIAGEFFLTDGKSR